MGIDVYAISEMHQEDMDAELKSNNLDGNLRRCKIAMWKDVFKYCTLISINTLQWTDVNLETLQSFRNMCNEILDVTSADFEMKNTECAFNYHDIVKLQTYLKTVVKYNAYLVVC
jgi:hypothetical protein